MITRALAALAVATTTLTTTIVGGADAVFAPLGPTKVAAGTDVLFDVTVAVGALAGFDAADVVIGSNDAADLDFAYSAVWLAAFANVSPAVFDVGFYAQDVFVGGNNPTSVGTSLRLGTIRLTTAGLAPGTYNVGIDSAVDFGVSGLTLGGAVEPLLGSAVFEVAAAPTASTPAHQESLWRSAGNIVRIHFDSDIVAPLSGQVLIQRMLPDGAFDVDQSAGFTFEVESDKAAMPRILRVVDADAADLVHREWYAVRNVGAWPGVIDFVFQYVVQVGDASNDGTVLHFDASTINAALPLIGAADDDRRDINGDGDVLNGDVSEANANIPSFAVPMPSGH